MYCVNVVGTQNAHNLISVSTDGKMCSWSLDMLSQPQVCADCKFEGRERGRDGGRESGRVGGKK